MTISRREMFVAGAVITALASGGVSACSPVDIPNIDMPGRYFAAIALGRLIEAREWAGETISLAIVSTSGTIRLEGAEEVGETISKMFAVEGFSMVGDSKEPAQGGMYWREIGPWLCSDMIKGGAVELGNCVDGLTHGVFNVLVDADFETEKIKTILLLENRNLIVQLADWPDAYVFGK